MYDTKLQVSTTPFLHSVQGDPPGPTSILESLFLGAAERVIHPSKPAKLAAVLNALD